jgi:hypothetical protein
MKPLFAKTAFQLAVWPIFPRNYHIKRNKKRLANVSSPSQVGWEWQNWRRCIWGPATL